MPSMFKIPMWDVEEPTHYSKRVASEVPGVVAVLLSSKMCLAWRDVAKKACGVINQKLKLVCRPRVAISCAKLARLAIP